jgi:hypothetical protein
VLIWRCILIICDLFVSLVKRFDLEDNPLDPKSIECQVNKVDGKDIKSTDAAESKECQANEVDGNDKKILMQQRC